MGSGGDAPKGGKTATTFRCEALCRHKGGGGWCRRGGVVGSEGKAAGRCGGGRRGGQFRAAAAHLQQKQHPQQLDVAEAAGGGVYAREAKPDAAKRASGGTADTRDAGQGRPAAVERGGGEAVRLRSGSRSWHLNLASQSLSNPPAASRRHSHVSHSPVASDQGGPGGPERASTAPSPRKSAMPWHGPRRDARTRRAGPSGCARACGCTCA